MNYPLVVATSLASTSFFAVSTVLKHHSATTLPAGRGTAVARVAHFIAATISHRWWLGGLVADAAGLGFQAYALHIGAVSVVQPLLVTGLLTSLAINHLTRGTRISPRELGWGAALVLALVGFLVVSGASSPHLHQEVADRGVAVIAAALAVALALTCIALARRVPAGRRAALLGVAVGTLYAFTAVLIKAATTVLANAGLWAMLTSWQLLVLLVCGAAGLMLNQLAFRAGPLNTSLPVIATVDPLLSVALGVSIYDEQLRAGPVELAAEAVLLLGLAVAAIALSRLNADSDQPTTSHPPS
ncbi:MAG: DMT family transporter [Nostocoides sp.]